MGDAHPWWENEHVAALMQGVRFALLVWRLDDPADPSSLHLVAANEAAHRTFGYDLRGWVGKRFSEVLPASSPAFRAEHAEVIRTGTPHDFGEIPYGDERIKDGVFAWSAFALPEGCLGIAAENVTKRQTLAHELQRTTAFLNSIVENIPDMIFVKEATELRFERINRAGEELLGLPREALLGKNDFDFFHGEQADFFQKVDRDTLQGCLVIDIPEEPIQTPEGERWLHTKKIPILDHEGTATHLLGISQDITEQRRAQHEIQDARAQLETRVQERTADLMRANEALRHSEEQLRQAQKMEAVGRLAGGVAHDFNNLLSVILSYAALIYGDLPEQSPVREDLALITQAAERATSLTQQLLAFSRQQVLCPSPVKLNTIVSDMEKMLRRLLGEDIELRKLLAPELGLIHADAGQVEQIILNLSLNARDAMPTGGKLTIETANVDLDDTYVRDHLGAKRGPHVMLAISDSGTGMTPEVKSRIFEPFFTTKEVGKGTGLGLSTVFGIVKQSGGDIWVYSEVGRGSTFKVYLPRISDATAQEATPSAVPAAAGGQETILLVEDEDLVRRAARASLRRLGYVILEASNAKEALLLCERYSGTIHLTVTDVVMPGMSGRELAERLARVRPGTKVLYMSGYTDDTVVHHGVLDRGIHFMQKPFTPEVLARRVREVLDAQA